MAVCGVAVSVKAAPRARPTARAASRTNFFMTRDSLSRCVKL
jgi:hypothetical protein